MEDEPNNLTGIAIIAMAGRFPGASNVESFWQNLQQGVESITFFSDEELLASGVEPALLKNPNYVKGQGILSEIEMFEANFFGFTPREAEILDPQHRIFLECAWEALELACCDTETYPGRVGVFAGCGMSTYLINNLLANLDIVKSMGAFQINLATDKDHLPTRVSYKLNLKGPSLSINTACSSSLVAVHLACQSLLNFECDLALAGGATISANQKEGYLYVEGGIESNDGHTRAFDACSSGMVAGNGAGVVVLKRLDEAVADRDYIYAVIKGSAINNDGAVKVGYTAPGVDGQAEVIAQAQALASFDPQTITYVETHGTATALGDPIEIAGLTAAFNAGPSPEKYCAIGSVKTNVGHLDTAAGVAGLIKTALALHHQFIPPSLNFDRPNPNIDFQNSPFFVNTHLRPWPMGEKPRRAGVSSFGIGGTNAHVVLEEAPTPEKGSPSRSWQMLVLSARTVSALGQASSNLQKYLEQTPSADLEDIAFSLQTGRRRFAFRQVLLCQGVEDALLTLENKDPARIYTASQASSSPPQVVFMFPGQGAQYVNMGLELYQQEPLFRQVVNECCDLLFQWLGRDIRKVIYPVEDMQQAAASLLDQTAFAQPALFVIEYSLARLWQSWGIQPAAMTGHSIGEYAAACLSGVFSLPDALKLVAQRGQLIQQMPGGAMLAVSLSETALMPYLNAALSLAVVNTPAMCVVSGTYDAIDHLAETLLNRNIPCQRLHTSHAFHSAMLDEMLSEFARVFHQVTLHPPQIPFISNLTGTWITASQATNPSYWVDHVRQTVRFANGVKELLGTASQIFLEVGPGRTLVTFVRQSQPAATGSLLTSLPHPKEAVSAEMFLLRSLAQLWLSGAAVDWQGFYRFEKRVHLPLPTYPFERQRYWIDARPVSAPIPSRPPLKESDVSDWFYSPSWKRGLLPPALPDQTGKLWLVFCSQDPLGEIAIRELRLLQAEVLEVYAGESFSLSDHTAVLQPSSPEDYRALLENCIARYGRPAGIVHLWNTGELELKDLGLLEYSFYSLLFLAQALGRHGPWQNLPLLVCSTNLQNVLENEDANPEKAVLLGPCKVIPQEMPGINCRTIDIEPLKHGAFWPATTIRRILAEANSVGNDRVIAYRAGTRWLQIFDPVRLEPVPLTSAGGIKERGVYLVTGGLGGIGLALAEDLANRFQARLVLLHRSDFPAENEWPQWLKTHPPQDHTSIRIRTLQKMVASGAEVMILKADVTDFSRMYAAVETARARFGVIHGVLHAAGLPGDGMIQLKTREAAAAVLAPKVTGSRVLENIFENHPLDFLILFSSLSAVTGGFGQVDYCSANAFLDSFASSQHRVTAAQTISINWSAWGETGMAYRAKPVFPAARSNESSHALTTAKALDLFYRILAHPISPQVIVSQTSLNWELERINQFLPEVLAGQLAQTETTSTGHQRPDLPVSYIAPRNKTEKELVDLWQRLLGIDQIGIQDNFFGLGGHSLLATQLASRMRDLFTVDISLQHIFDSPTIEQLAITLLQSKVKSTTADELLRLLEEMEE